MNGDKQYAKVPDSAFGVDDLQNQPLADWYGIVMGTRSVYLDYFIILLLS